jgi:hypothetical protein
MPKVVSISGLIGSGKDSVADYLIKNHQYKKLSFAGTLKDSVAPIFGWDREMLEGATKEHRIVREQVDTWWAARLKIPHLTPRWVLQQWGTEVCRTHFHQDLWVASVENILRKTGDKIVITDTRFKNELKAIKHVNGITIRVHRGPDPEWYDDAASFNKGPNGNVRWATGKATLDRLKIHASEYSSVGLKYDHHIHNDTTLEDLYATVENIINPQ